MKDFFSLYDSMIRSIPDHVRAHSPFFGSRWAMAFCEEQLGVAMSTPGSTIPPMFPALGEAFSLRSAAEGIKSWNLTEASILCAACNAYYNTSSRLEELDCFEPMENYCTAGLSLSGAKIALIGHLSTPDSLKEEAEQVYILERAPLEGDYPDSACDLILPQCDIVIITGSSLVNKTLPHLLDLCKNAYTILTGPTVPMCPALLEHGLDRVAGMIVQDVKAMREHIYSGSEGSPYRYGIPFLLKK